MQSKNNLTYNNLAFISVIVPVYNDPGGIKKTIEALLRQDYPRDKYEILIVDNNSTDDTESIIKSYTVIYLEEKEIQGSYAARNRGIKIAKGEILAFTDSNSIPSSDWLINGYKVMRDTSVVLGVGKIEFFSKNRKMNIYEIYDSSTFLKQHIYAQHNFGAGANIFIRKDTLDKVGLFKPYLISGGDYELGQRLSKEGFVKYIDNAIIKHPTRSTYKEILNKTVRIYTGLGRLKSLNLVPVPSNIFSLSSWFPVIRIWRAHRLWNRLRFMDKIRYYLLVNLMKYIGKVLMIKNYNKDNGTTIC